MPFFVISVALPVHLRQLFDYLPCSGHTDKACYKPGQRCLVTFGKRQLTGFVINTHSTPSVAEKTLKPIMVLLDHEPFIPQSALATYSWIAGYYHAPLGEIIHAALPPPLRKAKPQAELINQIASKIWKAVAGQNDPEELRIRGARQKALLRLLAEQDSGMSQKEILSQGFQLSQLKALHAKNAVSYHQEIITPVPAPESTTLPQLNHEQQTVLEKLIPSAGQYAAVVLQGVTGSGKTEVYIHWLHYLLTQKHRPLTQKHQLPEQQAQALILVPEIALTPQTIRRFKTCFGDQVIPYHSAMGDKERLTSWILTQQGRARIIIGTRSALLLPFQQLLTIIVDEEHDSSFKQHQGARYNARDLAILRAHQNNCPVILGSATPSFESLYNVSQSRFTKLRLNQRHSRQPLPRIELIDIKSRPLEGGISSPARQIIKHKLSAGEQVMVFINRRGFAPVIMCTDCGWTADCTACDVRLTYHLSQNVLRCHHCDRTYRLPLQCPSCHSTNIKPIGAGTERTEQVLASYFPDYPTIRIDRDNIQSRSRFNHLLEQINRGEPCLIIGTQMLAKGHDFPNLNTVLIVNADGGLFSSDFRATEKTAQLLLQVAGRAGRHHQVGQVLIQTQLPEHPLLQAICRHDYDAIYEAELSLRRQARLPPVSQLCILRAEAPDMQQGMTMLGTFRQEIENLADQNLRVLGPVHSFMQRKQGRYHSLLWILAEDKSSLQKLLQKWLNWRQQTRPKTNSRVRWNLDVDPVETM